MSKLSLINISLDVKHKRLFNIKKQLADCHEQFEHSSISVGVAETYYLEAVWHMTEFSIANPTQKF